MSDTESKPNEDSQSISGTVLPIENKLSGEVINVKLNNKLVKLLSEQLYTSPLKAIEEIVVNSYDADAETCEIFFQDGNTKGNELPIIIFDDGVGMSLDGLKNLWIIGRSNKRTAEIQSKRKRKQIGKFGIGKIAAYHIANSLTYISKGEDSDEIFGTSIKFSDLNEDIEDINLDVWRFSNIDEVQKITECFSRIQYSLDKARELDSWTITIMNDIKENITTNGLTRILSTSMPLVSGFTLIVNGDTITSSKEDYKKVVEFSLDKLDPKRLEDLEKKTGETWQIQGDSLVSKSFSEGIKAEVFVTERLLSGKSDDISRSNGFFIYVRDRLINPTNPLFGLTALQHGTFSRLCAKVYADDLDKVLKAQRETVGESEKIQEFRHVLRMIFNESYTRYTEYDKNTNKSTGNEGERKIVKPRLVEYPIADALLLSKTTGEKGAEADNSWFYADKMTSDKIDAQVENLYQAKRKGYLYKYADSGTDDRMVKFEPETNTFWINNDHEFICEYLSGDKLTSLLLEDFLTAEALLEFYLRDAGIDPFIIGNILEQRDKLLRALVKDHQYSYKGIAQSLRQASDDEKELEIMLVVAMRAMGFVANHISNSDKPDGLARFIRIEEDDFLMTLEAKSSTGTPSLENIDFAGLTSHMEDYDAECVLLLAPKFPGETRGDESQAAKRSVIQNVSCWKIEDLARIIEVADERHFNASTIINIVTKAKTPDEVETEINRLLDDSEKYFKEIYNDLLETFKVLEEKSRNNPRGINLIMGSLQTAKNYPNLTTEKLKDYLLQMTMASQGGMTFYNDKITFHIGLNELERRLSHLLKSQSKMRRNSNLRNNDN